MLVALLAAAALPFTQRPAQAADPPWCLFGSAGVERCYYDSLEACLRDRGPRRLSQSQSAPIRVTKAAANAARGERPRQRRRH